jgi:hypothetical protein
MNKGKTMRELIVVSEHLYQSQWWTRLAAFGEKRESPAPAKIRVTEKKRSSFSKTLTSLFRGFHFNQERGHAPFLSLGELSFNQESSKSAHL